VDGLACASRRVDDQIDLLIPNVRFDIGQKVYLRLKNASGVCHASLPVED